MDKFSTLLKSKILIIILLICYFLLFQNSTNAMFNGEKKEEHEQGLQKGTAGGNSSNSHSSESIFVQKNWPAKSMPPMNKGNDIGSTQKNVSIFGDDGIGGKTNQIDTPASPVAGGTKVGQQSLFAAIRCNALTERPAAVEQAEGASPQSSMFLPHQDAINGGTAETMALKQQNMVGNDPVPKVSQSIFLRATTAKNASNKSIFAEMGNNVMEAVAVGPSNSKPLCACVPPPKSLFGATSVKEEEEEEEDEINQLDAEEFAKKSKFQNNVHALLRRISTPPKGDQIYGIPILEVLLRNVKDKNKHVQWTLATYQWFIDGKNSKMLAFDKQQNDKQFKNRIFHIYTDDAFLKESMAEHGNESGKTVAKMHLLNALLQSEESGKNNTLMMFKHDSGNNDENFQIEIYKQNDKCFARDHQNIGTKFILFACPLASWIKNGCKSKHVFLHNHLREKLYELDVDELEAKCEYKNAFELFIQPAIVQGWEASSIS